MTINRAADTTLTLQSLSYDNTSYQEWCHQGTLLLIQFREHQRARRKEHRQHHRHPVVPLRKHPPYPATIQSHQTHRKSMVPATKHKRTIPSQKNNSIRTASTSSQQSKKKNSIIDENETPLGLLDDDDDDDGGNVMMTDEMFFEHPMTNEARMMSKETAPMNPKTNTATSTIASSLKRNNRSFDHLPDISMSKSVKKKLKKVFYVRSNVAKTIASTHSTTDGIIQFMVKETPPQFIALVEGVCCSGSKHMSNKNDSYYASERYHYLLDIVDHSQYHRLPNYGYANELPCVSPTAPGPWMVQIRGGTQEATVRPPTFFRNHQADWNGDRIRLVHMDYQLRLPSSHAIHTGTCCNNISTVRIDPNRYRLSNRMRDNASDVNVDNDDPQTQSSSTNSFIGAMGIAMFDGFASVSESEALQAALAKAVLNELHQILDETESNDVHRTGNAFPIIPSFTTVMTHSLPTEYTIGSGGIVIPINVGHDSNESTQNKRDGNDYFILLYICETTNQVVAIDGMYPCIRYIYRISIVLFLKKNYCIYSEMISGI